MQLDLHRTALKPKATLGHLDVDKVLECVTLEDAVRDLKEDGSGKVFGATAIPAGTYDVTIDFSQRFQKARPRKGPLLRVTRAAKRFI